MGYQEDFKKVLLGDPHVILGKKGATPEMIEHISKLIKRYNIVKIKALKSIANKSNMKQIAGEVAQKTTAYLLDVRGKTFVIGKNPLE
ncbi:MAG: YhbY family RNA-binding protein [Candidatus Lokiarchaeota archaeon]|nr:YhbY family RNA-binding protein [Candidatus Lokiarchaeota archaeon]